MLKFVNDAATKMEAANQDKSSKENSIQDSVLQKLLRIDRRHAILMAFDMIFAGVDNTIYSSAELLYQLATHQDKQAKLRDETFRLLPHIYSQITQDCLQHANYLRACIKESMRVKPTIPGHLRATGQDLIISGYHVPKMVCVFVFIGIVFGYLTSMYMVDQFKNGDHINGRVIIYQS